MQARRTPPNAPTSPPPRPHAPPPCAAMQDFAGGHVPGALNWEVDLFNEESTIDEVPAGSPLGPGI